jgi:hypothetical protein
MHESATRPGWRGAAIAAALLCAAMLPARADPPAAPPSPLSGLGLVHPPSGPAPGEAKPIEPEQTRPKPAEPWDFSLEALGEATKRFWAKVFDPKSFELQPLDPALTRRPGTVVRDQRACVSSSGVPDCATAAKAACTAKGFANGRPLDTESKRTCPPEVMLGLRKGGPDECRLDYVVSSSICW